VQPGDGNASQAAAASRVAGVVMSVVKAVKRDIADIRKRDKALGDSALAASALVLAEQLDDPENSATAKSMCARALREALGSPSRVGAAAEGAG
jgi:hypothetical protein